MKEENIFNDFALPLRSLCQIFIDFNIISPPNNLM